MQIKGPGSRSLSLGGLEVCMVRSDGLCPPRRSVLGLGVEEPQLER